jgi:hypothetical protein
MEFGGVPRRGRVKDRRRGRRFTVLCGNWRIGLGGETDFLCFVNEICVFNFTLFRSILFL